MTSVSSAHPAWQALSKHRDAIQRVQLRSFFAEDSGRAERFSSEAAGVFLDYSKNRITDETREAARRVAADLDVAQDESTIPRTTARSPVP